MSTSPPIIMNPVKITTPKLKNYKKFTDPSEDKTGFAEMKLGALRKALGLVGPLEVTLGADAVSRRGPVTTSTPHRPRRRRPHQHIPTLTPDITAITIEENINPTIESQTLNIDIIEPLNALVEEGTKNENEEERKSEQLEVRQQEEKREEISAEEKNIKDREKENERLRKEDEDREELRRKELEENERRRKEEEDKERRLIKEREEEEERQRIKREEEELRLKIEEEEKERKKLEEEIARKRAEEEERKRKIEEEKERRKKEQEIIEKEQKVVKTRKMLYDALYINQKEFSTNYQEILTIVRNCKDGRKLAEVLNNDLKTINAANEDFISLVDYCKSGDIKESDLSRVLAYVVLITSAVKKFRAEADKINLSAERIDHDSLLRAEQSVREMESEDMIIQTIADDEPPESLKTREENNLEEYWKLRNKLDEVEKSLVRFMKDDTLKKFRSECRKAVNTPVNAMSAVTEAHMTDKLNRLVGLLKGATVATTGDRRFSASQHKLGITYSMSLLAKKLVNQGEQVISSKQDAAFCLAALANAICLAVPDFTPLLTAQFHNVCPYLVPVYWDPLPGESDQDFNKRMGFLYSSEGEKEELNMFLKRMSGVARLYFAMAVVPPRREDRTKAPPLGLWEIWRWLASFINLDPKPDISATLLLDMLEVTGKDMVKVYRQNFQKLLHVVCTQYIPRVEKVTPTGRRGPVSRLKCFLEAIIYSNEIPTCKGLIPPNFW